MCEVRGHEGQEKGRVFQRIGHVVRFDQQARQRRVWGALFEEEP